MGHGYVIEVLFDKTFFWRMDQWDHKHELDVLGNLLPEDLLKSIRESVVMEVMGS